MSLVLISGGTGLVGSNLTRHLLARGFDIIILSRSKNTTSENPKISYSYWNVEKNILDVEAVKKAVSTKKEGKAVTVAEVKGKSTKELKADKFSEIADEIIKHFDLADNGNAFPYINTLLSKYF